MKEFRRLFLVAAASGILAGLLSFTAQYFAVIPLIQTAEKFEAAHEAHSYHEQEWKPSEGWQRHGFTALATILTSIGFSAVLFGLLYTTGRRINARTGVLWGLAGFVCFNLAPALGLPPEPPGVAVADLFDRQLWWAATVAATAIGLYLIAVPPGWLLKLSGIVCLVLPHAVGAPTASGQTVVPAQLVWQFTIASLATAALFWLSLGVIGGVIDGRSSKLNW